jgi:hypothetical protein
MSFFHKKMSQNLWATIMPFGPVTNILLAQKKIFGPAKGWPHFRHWLFSHVIMKNISPIDSDYQVPINRAHQTR